MEKTLYLIRGISGSGKTTFVQSIAQEGDAIICNDDFMLNEKGEYEFDWQRLEEVARKAEGAIQEKMKEDTERIFVHNTFTTKEELAPYYELAKDHGYRVFNLIVENRHGGASEHGTPESTRAKQRNRFDIQL